MDLVIDTDPALGIPLADPEDGVAIFLALNSPEAEVRGVTVCHGNVPLPVGLAVARRIVEVSGKRVPVVRGASGPWSLGKPTPASRLLSREARGRTVVAIAPLTNVATAILTDPEFVGNVERIVCMGGMVDHRWGLLPDLLQVEFNFAMDPRAASTVIGRAGPKLTLLPVDVCLKALFTAADLERLRRAPGRQARFLANRLEGWLRFSALHQRLGWPGPVRGFPMWDTLAPAAALWPGLFRTRTLRLGVSRLGRLAAGEGVRPPTQPRSRSATRASGAERPVEVAVDVDAEKFKERVLSVLESV